MRNRSVTAARARRALFGALLAGALLTACADGTGGDQPGEPRPTPSPSTPTLTPTPSTPTLPVLPTLPPTPTSPPTIQPQPTDRGGEVTLTGEVIEGVEAGCRLLRTSTGEYLLIGEAANQLRVGATVSVRGQVRTDVATICQQGTPFQVAEVLR
jgi:hypothetical protein